jgi:hypothetical protein
MRYLVSVAALLLAIGCQQPNPDPFSGMWPAEDAAFSPLERKIVNAARQYLEKQKGRTLDARYRVEQTAEGYEVYVEFVAGYERGRPLLSPGGHGWVLLDREGSVVEYKPGE